MKIFFSKECLSYEAAGHPESPGRVRSTYDYLAKKGYEFIEPKPASEKDVLLVHAQELHDEVKTGSFFDPDTPNLPGIYVCALRAAGAAKDAALWSIAHNEHTFSLMRPPGHHACRASLGGFCYFNNIAIAVAHAQKNVKKIAILDLDCHHGNGTEDIFFGAGNIIYISLHQSPLFPGTGTMSRKNCHNFPLEQGTDEAAYLGVLEKALAVIKGFEPGLIALSMGFDTYCDDPLTDIRLEKGSYQKIAEKVAALGKPVFGVLEGGYDIAGLPECVDKFLTGLGT